MLYWTVSGAPRLPLGARYLHAIRKRQSSQQERVMLHKKEPKTHPRAPPLLLMLLLLLFLWTKVVAAAPANARQVAAGVVEGRSCCRPAGTRPGQVECFAASRDLPELRTLAGYARRCLFPVVLLCQKSTQSIAPISCRWHTGCMRQKRRVRTVASTACGKGDRATHEVVHTA